MSTATMTKPREVGLLFTPENLRLVRAGLKWQTRRGIKPQPENHPSGYMTWPRMGIWMAEYAARHCPYGNPQLEPVKYYCKEAVQVLEIDDCVISRAGNYNQGRIWAEVRYVSDGAKDRVVITPADYHKLLARRDWRVPTSPMFMLKSIARTWLTGKRTWTERLGDMSAEDAVAEGIEVDPEFAVGDQYELYNPIHDVWRDYLSGGYDLTPVQSYATLWDSINGRGSWQSDKWCWCVEWEVPGDA